MKIEVHKEPFTYLSVSNLFTHRALDLIWREIDTLSDLDKMDSADVSSAHTEQGVSLAKHRCLFLDNVYTDTKYSTILSLYNTVISQAVAPAFESISTETQCIRYCNYVTKLGVYNKDDYYEKHHDGAYRFTALTYLHKGTRSNGGELYFGDWDFTFPCNDNSLIMFPSHHYHEVTPMTGDGRHYIANFFYSPAPTHHGARFGC